MVEFSHYRCFLLGLPEQVLPTTPAEIIRLMHGRAATLRDDVDDEICGVKLRLASYGNAEFTSDHAVHTPVARPRPQTASPHDAGVATAR